MVHQQTTQLVEDLKGFELPAIIPRSPVDKTDFTRQLASTASGSAATAATVSTMLETAMEELFVPYTEGQRYLERESKSLSELYASFLTNFTRYHVCAFLVLPEKDEAAADNNLGANTQGWQDVVVRPYGQPTQHSRCNHVYFRYVHYLCASCGRDPPLWWIEHERGEE